jgi:ligand-binding sensor domain-containing protein
MLNIAFTGNAQSNGKNLFNNLKVKDGLESNQVFEIEQDSIGFMWFATNNGFVRYDGYNMSVFRKDRERKIALPNNEITSVKNAKNLGLWIGSYEGLIYFDTKNAQSQLIDLGGIREIRCILNQGDSIIWAGSSEGLFKINASTLSYQLYNQQNSNLGSDIIRSLYLDSKQNLWIGTFNGLNLLSKEGNISYFNLKQNYKEELKNNLVLDIKPYSNENDSLIWVGTETGLVLFNTTNFNISVFNSTNTNFENEVIKCIYSKKPGHVYLGTDLGFYYLNTFTNSIESSFHDPFNNYSISNNVVWDIFEDNSGIIWLATANGLSRISDNQGMFKFHPVYSYIDNNITGTQVNDIYSDKKGTTWLATKNGVIAKHPNGETESFTANNNSKNRLVLNNINTISGDQLGRIWIGSAGGINIWDPSNNKMHTITSNFDLSQGLRSNYIGSFIAPNDGSFWVSTWGGGMYKVNGNFEKISEIRFEYIANFNTNVYATDKNIWLKNDDRIFSINLNTNAIETSNKLNKTIATDNITSLYTSKQGVLWIGTHNLIFEYNTQTDEIKEYNIFTGRDSYIYNLIEDKNGNLWGTTLTSIIHFNTGTKKYETYPKNEGIPLDYFLIESKAISNNGNIYFGGNDGYISFNPNDIEKDTFEPKTLITGFKVNNKKIGSLSELGNKNNTLNHISYTNNVVLKYDQHSFSLNFSSLHYGNTERNIYAYKLEGYDEDWNYTSGIKNTASYSNLSAGKYQFKVKGTNNDGVWFDNESSIQIRIKPPVWASPFAIVVYIIILQVLLVLLITTYRNKVQWKEKIRTITLEKEKNEELAKLKQQFFTNISHEFRTPLSLILGPAETLLKNQKLDKPSNQLLGLISKNAQRLFSLVNQLLDLRKIELST